VKKNFFDLPVKKNFFNLPVKKNFLDLPVKKNFFDLPVEKNFLDLPVRNTVYPFVIYGYIHTVISPVIHVVFVSVYVLFERCIITIDQSYSYYYYYHIILNM